MLAFEITASIDNHRLVIQDLALPAHADHARVIVLWESIAPTGRRMPPPALADMGEEKGDILRGPPESGLAVDGRFPVYQELSGLLV